MGKRPKDQREPKPAKPPPLNRPFSGLGALKDALAKEEEARKNAPPRPATRPMPREKVTAAEDEASFHRLIAGVTPLGEGKSRVPKTETAPASERAAALPRGDLRRKESREAEEVHEHLRQLVEGNARFEVSDDGRRVEGRRVDLNPELLRKLRRGLFPVDARLDLHGKGALESREEVAAFLREKRARGERCVLVIHGKGEHSPARIPVLRGEIAAWLSQGRASEHVAAFATATEDDGGEGAVYVLLRRG
jgi:DNA-nicking Smr family endonuclease